MQDDGAVDLRPYLKALARKWALIASITLIAAAIGFGSAFILPKTYSATSSVLVFIRQTGSQFGTNESILNIETIDAASRRLGLVALAESEAIEAQIPADVTQRIAPKAYQVGQFIQDNQVEVTSEGELIQITAYASTPRQAKDLADAWATTFVNYAQTLYTDEHTQIQLASNALLPLSSSSPVPTLNTAVAGFLGALAATVFVLAQYVRTRWADQEVEQRSTQQRTPNYSTAS